MKSLIVLFSLLVLSACSSTPKKYSGEFCHNLTSDRSEYVMYKGCIDTGNGTGGNDGNGNSNGSAK